MFDAFKRLQLQRRGMSCGRTRKTTSDSTAAELLRYSGWIKLAAFMAFVAALTFLVVLSPVSGAVFETAPAKAAATIAVIFVVALLQFYANHPNSFRRNSRVVLIFGLILFQVAIVKGICGFVRENGLNDERFMFLLIPYGLGAMTLSVMLGRAQGILVAVFGSLWGCLVVPAEYLFPFLVTSLVAGFVAVYVTDQVRKRSQLLRAGLYLGVAGLVLTAVMGFLPVPPVAGEKADQDVAAEAAAGAGAGAGAVVAGTGAEAGAGAGAVAAAPEAGGVAGGGDAAAAAQEKEKQPEPATLRDLVVGICTVLLVGAITATIVSGGLPVLESLFHVTTDISWIELADLNHPLLKRMTIEAPGTYHHSLVVANLAEAAAEAIGANATLCRVGSYFHDIGKLAKPGYFIENIDEEHNPHDDLTPTMSALVISAHVKEGVDLAIKNKLNAEIIDIIEQHHGTSLIYYFYRRALDQQEDAAKEADSGNANEEDVPEVDEKNFRYPGPKPVTRESAIISLADSVESASRSLAKPTPARIEQLIEDIVLARLKDGQLDDCDLTLGELEVAKRSFATTLRTMLHKRVSYPGGKESEKGRDRGGKDKSKTKTHEFTWDRPAGNVRSGSETTRLSGGAGSGSPKGGKRQSAAKAGAPA